MDMTELGFVPVAAIVVLAFLVGLTWKKADRLNDKWIPIVCGVAGAGLGIVGMLTMPDFPAADYISAAAVGIVSGLAATGFDQAIKQMSKKTEIDYKTGYFNAIDEKMKLLEELEKIGEALGAKYFFGYEFEDGTNI